MVWVQRPKGAVCKTVGSAYVGSNPTPATTTPATTSENGPLAAETRPGGPFPSRHDVYQYVSLWVDAWQCARTYGVQRPGRTSGAYNRSLCRSAPILSPYASAGPLVRLLSAAHKAGWLSSVMPAPGGWLGLPARCGRADAWIVPRHMAWLSLQAVARRRRRWGGRPVRRGAERPGGERAVASYRPEGFHGVACQDIGPEPVMHLRWTGDAPVVYLRR